MNVTKIEPSGKFNVLHITAARCAELQTAIANGKLSIDKAKERQEQINLAMELLFKEWTEDELFGLFRIVRSALQMRGK